MIGYPLQCRLSDLKKSLIILIINLRKMFIMRLK